MIPKIIHYCWYGGAPHNEMVKKCIASWKRVLPDYEIICWDESNTPFKQIPILKVMYKRKKWAFIADYMRFYSLYFKGGIYLDTDIEMIKPFGDMMKLSSFTGFQTAFGQSRHPINTAVLGGIPKHSFFKDCLEMTERKQRLNFHQMGSPTIASPYLIDRGVSEHKTQEVGGVTVFTKDYFYPYYHRIEEFSEDCITENTVCIHWWADSWSEKNRTLSYKLNSAISKLKRVPLMSYDWFIFLFFHSRFYNCMKTEYLHENQSKN